nr:putative reverse transcriptase domain-containing protein [Tanacetum cinerariifolium]
MLRACAIDFGENWDTYLPKRSKLAPRYVARFEIVEQIGPVAYRLRLPQEVSGIHDMFYMSNLKKYLADTNLHVPLDEINIDNDLRFVEEPIEIIDRERHCKRQSDQGSQLFGMPSALGDQPLLQPTSRNDVNRDSNSNSQQFRRVIHSVDSDALSNRPLDLGTEQPVVPVSMGSVDVLFSMNTQSHIILESAMSGHTLDRQARASRPTNLCHNIDGVGPCHNIDDVGLIVSSRKVCVCKLDLESLRGHKNEVLQTPCHNNDGVSSTVVSKRHCDQPLLQTTSRNDVNRDSNSNSQQFRRVIHGVDSDTLSNRPLDLGTEQPVVPVSMGSIDALFSMNTQSHIILESATSGHTLDRQARASGPTSDYKYIRSCSYSCQYCEALF